MGLRKKLKDQNRVREQRAPGPGSGHTGKMMGSYVDERRREWSGGHSGGRRGWDGVG